MRKSIMSVFGMVVILLLHTGCKIAKDETSNERLGSTTWELASIGGKSIQAADYPNGLPEILFAGGNKISGKGGCNRYEGSYTLNGNGKFSIGQIISTKMFCPGGGEEQYLVALAKADKAEIKGEMLILYNGSQMAATFISRK